MLLLPQLQQSCSHGQCSSGFEALSSSHVRSGTNPSYGSESEVSSIYSVLSPGAFVLGLETKVSRSRDGTGLLPVQEVISDSNTRISLNLLFQVIGMMNYGYGAFMLSGTSLVSLENALEVSFA